MELQPARHASRLCRGEGLVERPGACSAPARLSARPGRLGCALLLLYCFALWGVVSGVVIWGELPNALAFTGIALIVGSGVAIVVLDQRRGRKEVALADAL